MGGGGVGVGWGWDGGGWGRVGKTGEKRGKRCVRAPCLAYLSEQWHEVPPGASLRKGRAGIDPLGRSSVSPLRSHQPAEHTADADV